MKKTAFLLLVMAFAITGNAQTSKITGSWLMTKAETEDKVQEPYFITSFKENGKMEVMEVEVGTWKYNNDSHAIIMESELDKDFNGEGRIIKLTKKELVVSKDGAKLYYTKVFPDEIAENNKKSNFPGTWKIENTGNADATGILKFELPDSYVFIEIEYGSTSTTKGSWMFDPKEDILLFIGFSHSLRGKNTITALSDDKFTLENNGNIITAVKENTESAKIERLTFEFEEFEDPETGDYINSDENSLPWLDFEELILFLENIEYVKYKQGKLLKDVTAFTYSNLMSTIQVDTDEQSVEFTNFIISEGDTMQYSQNYKGGLMERYNYFFPKEGPMPFRILGTESITVAAGTFECTVVEGFDGFDKKKYWMINNMPGIYAKIIQEQEDAFGDLEYLMTELEEIK
jgi:hypothetical protein